jgi:hypothetical protein
LHYIHYNLEAVYLTILRVYRLSLNGSISELVDGYVVMGIVWPTQLDDLLRKHIEHGEKLVVGTYEFQLAVEQCRIALRCFNIF